MSMLMIKRNRYVGCKRICRYLIVLGSEVTQAVMHYICICHERASAYIHVNNFSHSIREMHRKA